MKINVAINQLVLVCMHPLNDTFPIFTAHADGFSHDLEMHFDHDTHLTRMENFKLDDNSNYPRTLDPTIIYTQEDKIQSQTILDRKN